MCARYRVKVLTHTEWETVIVLSLLRKDVLLAVACHTAWRGLF